VKPIREDLFALDERGDPYLVGGRCPECDRLQFPLAATCPACGGGAVEPVRLARHGEVPFGFGVVELADGLRVITRIEEPDPARLEFGMPMQLTLVELGPDADGAMVTTYSFTAALAAST